MTTTPHVQWPEGKTFAFSVVDDTDRSTLENAPPVYDLLMRLGFRTTKTVWTLRGSHGEDDGATCENRQYLDWARWLARNGFEIAMHNAASRTSPREQTQQGIERFAELFGDYPSIHVNHSVCRENIYWGDRRLSGVNALAYNVLNRFKTRGMFQGDMEESPLFWGDICRERIRYVRNFIHSDINTLRFCPQMPYHDPERPYVNAWFASTEGPNVDTFVAALTDEQLDRLEAEGGACIMYTHFGVGFAPGGRLDPRFEDAMQRLAARNGWFVPVTTLLDHLATVKGRHEITAAERSRLERRWLAHKVRVGGRS